MQGSVRLLSSRKLSSAGGPWARLTRHCCASCRFTSSRATAAPAEILDSCAVIFSLSQHKVAVETHLLLNAPAVFCSSAQGACMRADLLVVLVSFRQ